MLFHNARLAVYTLILALMFSLGASISPAQESVPPAAYLAANSLRGIELFALYADGSLAETPVLLEGQILYGVDEAHPQSGQTHIEVPEDFVTDEPQFVNVTDFALSPNALRAAFISYLETDVFAMSSQPNELVIMDIQADTTFRYPDLKLHWNKPIWSPDSTAILFNQH